MHRFLAAALFAVRLGIGPFTSRGRRVKKKKRHRLQRCTVRWPSTTASSRSLHAPTDRYCLPRAPTLHLFPSLPLNFGSRRRTHGGVTLASTDVWRKLRRCCRRRRRVGTYVSIVMSRAACDEASERCRVVGRAGWSNIKTHARFTDGQWSAVFSTVEFDLLIPLLARPTSGLVSSCQFLPANRT